MAQNRFLYRQLYETIKQRMEDGSYQEGALLPAEADFCREFQVSAITVKKALALLTQEGLVRRVPGRGTLVCGRGDFPARPAERPHAEFRKIGVVLEHVASPFGLEMLYRLDQEAAEAGFKLEFRFSYSDQEKESEEIAFLLSEQVEGLILMPCRGVHYNTAILRLVLDRFPVVLIDKKLEGLCLPSVRTDNRAAAALLARSLIDRGCRSIAMVSSLRTGTTSVREREKGFLDELRRAGIEPRPAARVSPGELLSNLPSPQAVEELAAWLREQGVPDGIVCLEYGFVPALLRALEQVCPGGEPRICCFDEDYLAPGGPRFTHVKQDEALIAKRAFALLRGELETGEISEEECLVPCVFREAKD